MKIDTIVKVQIDDYGKLRIYPAKEKFNLIWRSATEVHWDDEGFLYSPKSREWSYLDWYRQIVSVIKNECSCLLTVNQDTLFIDIPVSLKENILYV